MPRIDAETATGPQAFEAAEGRKLVLALEDAGIDTCRITEVNLCTACHPELFYSYRRDGTGTSHMTSGIARIQ